MAISTPENETPAASEGPVIPNFRDDERARARYASMLERRIKTFGIEYEGSIRRNASAKRDELREELDKAQAEWVRCKEAADAAREAYRQAFPQLVKKTRLDAPSVVDNVRSLGAASKLHHAAEEAWFAAEKATSAIRKIEHNENQLDIELKKALERAPAVAKEVTESAKWLAEIHAEEELGNARAKVEAIDAERDAYAVRLAAGGVSPEELRLRTFAEADIKPVRAPIDGLMFDRVEQYGPATYFILRDLRKQLYALPYDHRLEPIVGDVYDLTRTGKETGIRRTTRENSQVPLSLLDHFMKCHEGDDAAGHAAYHAHQEFVKQHRLLATMTGVDEADAAMIELFAAVAARK